MTNNIDDEELQQPLIDEGEGSACPDKAHSNKSTVLSRVFSIVGVGLIVVSIGLVFAVCGALHHCDPTSFLQKNFGHHKHHHAHISYQAVLQPNNEIEYSREFSVPCGYGILVFNIGPALDYEPFMYDIYQDAYVYSNNQKMCWVYPSYRGIQKGPFPFWVQGDPTSLDVPTGQVLNKISSRIVRPTKSKDFSAVKGGDFLVVAKGNFYTPAFYKNLKNTVQGWKGEGDIGNFGDFEDLLEDVTVLDTTAWEAGEITEIEVLP